MADMQFSCICMFSAIVIHSGSNRSPVLRYLVAASNCLEVVRDIDHLPKEDELAHIIRTFDPEVAVVDLFCADTLAVVTKLRELVPNLAILGFGASLDAALLSPQTGLDILLSEHISAEVLRSAIHDALRKQRGGIEKTLFCFVPAKAGSGSSTIVLNTAAAMAREHGKRILVVDADLRSGVLALLLGTKPIRSIQSLLANIKNVDQLRFPEMVYSVGGVDYLFSSRSIDSTPPEWGDYFHLLSTVRGMYDAILVDLPELVNSATFEFVRRSQSIYVICTPEPPALTLAKQRCDELIRFNIPPNRIGLLVNRWHRSDLSSQEISHLVGQKVIGFFPNDYPSVRSSIMSSRPVSPRSRLGGAYAKFAGLLFGETHNTDATLTEKLKFFWSIGTS
jgi:pilus assembly protein CpaE